MEGGRGGREDGEGGRELASYTRTAQGDGGVEDGVGGWGGLLLSTFHIF